MGVVFLITMGAILGWLMSIMARSDGNAHVLNMISGVAGALVAGLVVAPLLDSGNLLTGAYSVKALLLSTVGAIVVISVVNFFRQQEAR